MTETKTCLYNIFSWFHISDNISKKRFLNSARKEYLEKNKWISWAGHDATFTFADYVAHVGRMKSLTAFDDFTMKQPETGEFGNSTTDARHFTGFSL